MISKILSSSVSRSAFFILAGLLFYIPVFLLSQNFPFFWDSITLSSQASSWFMDHGIGSLILPDDINAGHPPLFSLYLLGWWKILGRELWVSHLAMFPLLLGSFIIWMKVFSHFLEGSWIYLAAVFYLLEPTLLAQSVMVSPDIAITCFFGLGVWGVLKKHKLVLLIANLLLAYLSLRGIFGVIAIFLLDLSLIKMRRQQILDWAILVPYFIPAILSGLWFLYHYKTTGWAFANPDSPWSGNQEILGLSGMLRNLMLIIWRILDFGRVFLWLAGGFIFLWFFRLRRPDQQETEAILLFIIPLMVICSFFLPFANPVAHRYLIVIYLLFIPFVICQVKKLRGYWSGITSVLILTGLMSGHCWIYPDKVAQGWDASLAHIPWFDLRKSMHDFIEEEGIDPSEIGTEFPNTKDFYFTDLSDSHLAYPDKDSRGMEKYPYVIYSNIMNDFSDAEYDELMAEWTRVVEFRKKKIFVILFRRPF